MTSRIWNRPSSIPYPFIWSTFQKRTQNGELLEFQIQDLCEDLFPSCINFMTQYFLPDEPLYNCLDFLSDSRSVENQKSEWKEVLPHKLSLICTIKNENNPTNEIQIAGIYILYYHHQINDDDEGVKYGEKFKMLSLIITHLEEKVERYKLFKIDDYLDEFGICVHPNYRGMGIATELLKARVQVGAAVGLKMSFTICTAIASQKASEKAGYKTLVEVKYTELEKLFPMLSLKVKDTPTIRLMFILHN